MAGGLRILGRRQGIAAAMQALALGGMLALGGAAAADDAAEAGKAQFVAACGTCHTVGKGEPNRIGPNLAGIIGRKAGSVETFKYSAALKGADFVWDDASLDAWMEDAQAFRPGTTMSYRQRDPDKRKRLLAYLKSLSGTP